MTSDTARPCVSQDRPALHAADRATETLSARLDPTPAPTGDWMLTIVAALCEAEVLLDRLERQGFTERELVILGESSFAVRWR